MNIHESIQPLLAAYEFGMLAGDQRAEVEAHIMECDLCFEDLFEFSPVSKHARSLRARTPVRTARRPTYRYLLAAAIAVLAAAGIWMFRFSAPEDRSIQRGASQIMIDAPASQAATEAPVLFRWRNRGADEYRLSIFTEEGKLVQEARTPQHEFLWDPRPAPLPGTYRWTVEAYLDDGTRIASSQVSQFQLRKR